MPEAVIVDCLRTAVGKAPRGALRNTRPDDLAATVIRALARTLPPGPKTKSKTSSSAAPCPKAKPASTWRARPLCAPGLPDSVPGITINRFCSSGLQAIAMAADRIRAGGADIIIAGGSESMSMIAVRRQQARAQSLVRRPLARDLHEHGPHRRARAAQVQHHARGCRRVRLPQPPERPRAPRPQGNFDDEIVPVEVETVTPGRRAKQSQSSDATKARAPIPRSKPSPN